MQPLDYCRAQAAQGNGVFAPVYRLLPSEKRDALMVLDVFHSELRRLPFEHSDGNVAMSALEWRRQDLAKALAGELAEHPVHQAAGRIAQRFHLPAAAFESVMHSAENDLTQLRYGRLADLQDYLANTGLWWEAAARICGTQDAAEFARKSGAFVRSVEILRDVGKDARAGRIYLPVDEMQQFGVPAAALTRGGAESGFAALMAAQIGRAEQMLREALAVLPSAAGKEQKPLLAVCALYRALLAEIRSDGAANVLNYTLAIPKPRQARIVWKTRWFGLKA